MHMLERDLRYMVILPFHDTHRRGSLHHMVIFKIRPSLVASEVGRSSRLQQDLYNVVPGFGKLAGILLQLGVTVYGRRFISYDCVVGWDYPVVEHPIGLLQVQDSVGI